MFKGAGEPLQQDAVLEAAAAEHHTLELIIGGNGGAQAGAAVDDRIVKTEKREAGS